VRRNKGERLPAVEVDNKIGPLWFVRVGESDEAIDAV
jgi:hypothetical protein